MEGSDTSDNSLTQDLSSEPFYVLEFGGDAASMQWLAKARGGWGREELPLRPALSSPCPRFEGQLFVDGDDDSAPLDRDFARALLTLPRSGGASKHFALHVEPTAIAGDAGRGAAARERDQRLRAQHRRQLQRRVDPGNQDDEEFKLRDKGDDRFTPPTACPSGPSRSTLSRASSFDSLRAHRHRPAGHICEAFVKDLRRKIKIEVESEAWETEYKFPDYALGIIPESYCLRSEYFEYDLLTQYGEVPGYPEGRGILESRSSKIKRGILEDSYSRKRRHDEEYEKEMSILNSTKDKLSDSQKPETGDTIESNPEDTSESAEIFSAASVTIGIQVSLDALHVCDDHHQGACYCSTPGTDEGYETTTKSKNFPSFFPSKPRRAGVLDARKLSPRKASAPVASIPATGKRLYATGTAHTQGAAHAPRPKRLPPLPGRRCLAQKLSATRSDSRLQMRLLHKNRHLPPIGERGQGDEPCKYVPSRARMHDLPSKYPCLPPIGHGEDAATASAQAHRLCHNNEADAFL